MGAWRLGIGGFTVDLEGEWFGWGRRGLETAVTFALIVEAVPLHLFHVKHNCIG